jgi:dehydrogenase/reductase SDR family protein 1
MMEFHAIIVFLFITDCFSKVGSLAFRNARIVMNIASVEEFSSTSYKGTALVTGASRGIGKGIALGLADAGYKVYITGRSVARDTVTEPTLGGSLDAVFEESKSMNLKGTIVPLQCNHKVDSEVRSVVEKIQLEDGRLDILVNNAFQIPSNDSDKDILFRDFYDHPNPGEFWDSIIDVGLRSHYITTCYSLPLLKQTSLKSDKCPLICHISSFGGAAYSFNVAYGVGKGKHRLMQ